MRNYYSFSLASILTVVLSAPAFAQEATPAAAQAVVQQDGVISYTPADFAASRPNTALDMISRIPGFSFNSGDQVRGFAGAAGNVLVDGQRPTVKTDSLDSVLSRIQIAQVERIDVIRGGAPGIDMQGQTVVANVIVKKSDTFQQVISAGGVNSGLFQLMSKTLQGDYGAMKFELNNAAKDLRYYAHLTESVKVPSMIGTSVHQALNTAVALGYGSEMVPSLVKAQAQLNQVKISPV